MSSWDDDDHPVFHTNDWQKQTTEDQPQQQQPIEGSKRPGKKSKKKQKAPRGNDVENLFDERETEAVREEREDAAVTALPPVSSADVEEERGVEWREDDFPPDRLALTPDIPPAKQSTSPQPVHAKPRQISKSSPTYGYSNGAANPHAFAPTMSKRVSYTSSPPNFIEPKAPPHMPQPHFYGSPILNLDDEFKKLHHDPPIAGSNGYCCCLDSLADAGDGVSAKKARDALLVGSEGGLEVFRVLPNKVEVVGRLEGLRGSVIGAKILPHVSVHDSLEQLRPLVAVILHGAAEGASHSAVFYQTTVEVYSLQTQERVATLYQTVAVEVPQPTVGHLTTLPEPVEDLRLTACGSFVLLASGKSGEVFVFSTATTDNSGDGEFRCIGKFWTSLQSSSDQGSSRPPSSGDAKQPTGSETELRRLPLLSLSPRWLALVPPPSASHVSIQGSPLLSEDGYSPPGLASAVAPPQPHVSCETVGTDPEDAWSRLTRQAAQGVVKYSQKGIDLGLQGWRELTNPAPLPDQRAPGKEQGAFFPPTKAPPHDPQRTEKDPSIVAIVDLQALLEAQEAKAKQPPTPVASFALPEGCNFLAFSRSGLRLLTVSRKGETYCIWDLTRSCHGIHRSDGSAGMGPSVRLIHSIPRSSPSVVVDSAWSRNDDYLALLTMHGTVHLHEIVERPSFRRRKRRSTASAYGAEKAEATVSVSQGASPPSSNAGFFGSVRSTWQQVSTQVGSMSGSGVRSSSGFGIPRSFAGFRDATASVGHAGGRVIAKGLSHGFSAAKDGASDYWHSEDNKIRHKALLKAQPASLKWLKRQSDLYLAVVCGGAVHLHPVTRLQRSKGQESVTALKHDKYGHKKFELPPIRTRASAEVKNGALQARHDVPHGFWSLRRPPADIADDTPWRKCIPPPSTQVNDVETNPPYCPFHIDPRVDIYVYDENQADSPQPSTFSNALGHGQVPKKKPSSPWLFGEPLPSATKMNLHDNTLQAVRRDFELDSDVEMDLAEAMRSVTTICSAADGDGREEIRVVTQRVRESGEGESDGDGFAVEEA
ncbi:hypothetical protein BDY17DRAFT_309209 [Neohortaea acidophila]|uniref:WD40-repeat-containing domain protein n=1 Tax=Neohortaea acidophila TaxID=245834 RepID=A0A6A6PVX6_9PEZI|nr:uncharacterized protein BDY17DRAFT_309209 [Neohortaea acidophila]KAF2483829.1 hypothetical protein BDY17DRAFT_309209 [Neohortaea acidophila]